MRMKKEIKLEIAREGKKRRKCRRGVKSGSTEESDGTSEDVHGKRKGKSETKGERKASLSSDESDKLVRLMEGMMARQDEMMRELEEVKGKRQERGKDGGRVERRMSVRSRSMNEATGEHDDAERGMGKLATPRDKQKGVMLKATYVPRAALDEDEYDDDIEVVGEVPIATEQLCNGLNRAWLARQKLRENKNMGPVRQANVVRMVTKQAKEIDESVRIQAMINVVCAYGGEVLDDMGFEELVRELGVIYK